MAAFDPEIFDREVLQSNGIDTAFGVPDSSLSGILSYFSATKPTSEHVVLANEGAAVGLAVGYYLATRKIALAYVQNSGLANALNPLQSIAAKEVFGIPMLLMIGWRGKPGEKDEPQHALIGPRLLDNLEANGFPYEEIRGNLADAKATVSRLIQIAEQKKTPVALIVPRNTFAEYKTVKDSASSEESSSSLPRALDFVKATRWLSPMGSGNLPLSRELVLRHSMDFIDANDTTVSSLGGNSRELYMIHKEKGGNLGQNFFCIGGMGHSFALAQGLAVGFAQESRRIWCLDGDGSFIMHLGNNAVLAGLSRHSNVVHVVIYNGVYSSTGSQPLMIQPGSFLDLAEGLPYQQKIFVDNVFGLRSALSSATGGTLIVAVTNDRFSSKLPRPVETSTELKYLFLENIQRLSNGITA
ncbi:thiamine diphosphate-binding protein [Polychaeton citri CBS 116435]|uniref:Thiamine diphosphate-binding protein n=1 Tax=Polychaeton citri CBS 116435 TaxID=1314669 RepID=A0A9P4QK33_9PEZI|nr:thiamine diphosphate-binding protein [Polychaeton citri CBS 116435]